MMLNIINNSDFFSYVILPFLIFLSRVIGQSVSMMRLIFASRGYKKIVFFIGFFEALIWIIAIVEIMKHLDNIFCYIAFALGFAVGSFVGVYLEEKISIGTVVIRVILPKNTEKLLNHLREAGYGVTCIDAEGMNGAVKIAFTSVKRKEINNVTQIIHKHNPKAFYTIEEVRKVGQGYFVPKTQKVGI